MDISFGCRLFKNPLSVKAFCSVPIASQTLADIRSVAVVGAGVSGILTTRHLREAGLDMTVF
jgi:NADPH-dependent 2,4-dienoyl-CoA reductase/sulfur reductase-like enzyme